MYTRNGEPSRLNQTGKTYNFYAKMDETEKGLLRKAQGVMRDKLGDTPSNPVLMTELLRAYVAAAA